MPLRCRLGNGDCYEGDFKANHYEGEGSYLSPDKQVYTGNWHEHRRHGFGEQTYRDGCRYSGDWIANKRHGFGKLSDAQDESVIYEVALLPIHLRQESKRSCCHS